MTPEVGALLQNGPGRRDHPAAVTPMMTPQKPGAQRNPGDPEDPRDPGWLVRLWKMVTGYSKCDHAPPLASYTPSLYLITRRVVAFLNACQF